MTPAKPSALLTEEDVDLILQLAEINTVTPMETGRASDLSRAQRAYAQSAQAVGFEPVHFGPPPRGVLDDRLVPRAVHRVAEAMGGDRFLEVQPNLVLQLGPRREPKRTLVFNFHMDTVDGHVPVGIESGRLTGRGVVDNKGPGVALLSGVRSALGIKPDLAETFTVLVQSVGGEEGGAMGVYGTRQLVRDGWWGRLNLVCEPTGSGVFDRTTMSMTVRIEVDGPGATDDEPERGLNATLILAALALALYEALDEPVRAEGGKLCIGGLHTGTMHNRVYGQGSLAVNLAYPAVDAGKRFSALLEDVVSATLTNLGHRWAGRVTTAVTVAGADDSVRLVWEKRDLPVLNNRDAELEAVFSALGWPRIAETDGAQPFTCDAVWFSRDGAYTVIGGPGELGRNGAHTPAEWVSLDDLNLFALRIRDLLLAFASRVG